jgi:hypothetical protein
MCKCHPYRAILKESGVMSELYDPFVDPLNYAVRFRIEIDQGILLDGRCIYLLSITRSQHDA